MTVNSPAFPRSQLPVDDEKSDSVLSASQVISGWPGKGARVFLAVIRPVESDPVPPVVASVAARLRMCQLLLSNLISRPDPLAVRCPGYPSCCLSFLKCFSNLCRLVCPLNVQKGTLCNRCRTSATFSVDVPLISVGIPRVGEAGHQLFEGWNT